MKRKLTALLFALLLSLSLTACSMKTDDKGMNNGQSSDNNGISSIISSLDDATTPQSSNSNAKITEEKAKEIALNHAGLKAEDITGYRIELDRDDGILSYEIEFNSNGNEYDYDINAENGNIIKSDKELID